MLSRATRRFALLGLAAFLILGGGGAALALREAPSAQTQAELLSHVHRLVADDTALDVRPAQLRPLLHLDADKLTIDSAGLERLLASRFADRPARDAALQVVGNRVVVVPGAAARTLDARATASALLREPESTIHRVRFRWTAPDVTTAELESLRIRGLVSEFTTSYPAGEPRVVNIKRAAELLDGTILRAGATFSMNQSLGERTPAEGFVPAPTIYGGRLVDSVGGGISQVATTLYNAAFFAGLDLVAHTPHSLYIDRYPMGREATISWGGPELIFRNDWNAAVLMKFEATDTSITVRFYSSELGRRVETTTGTPYRWAAPVTREVADSTLAPGARVVVQEPGASGFTVDYTRKVFAHDRLLRDERFTTRYQAKNGIVHVGVPVLEQR
jgi:vancomycin resistance protein YoaR